MKRSTKRAVTAALTSATVAASLIGLTSTSAFAITDVACTSNEFAMFTIHQNTLPPYDFCYAGGGEDWGYTSDWVTKIWSGNNRVQWYGDGRWQPDQPIEKWTLYSWPNHPGGVDIQAVRIV